MRRGSDVVHPYEVVKHFYGGGMEESTVPGLTIREHFAAMAMQGCLALQSEHRSPSLIATEAVMMADALLAELAKPAKP